MEATHTTRSIDVRDINLLVSRMPKVQRDLVSDGADTFASLRARIAELEARSLAWEQSTPVSFSPLW